MTINEFFSKENILGDNTFSNVTFKEELTSEDYKRMGAFALKVAFENREYIPLAGRLAIESAIVIALLDLQPDEIDDEKVPNSECVFQAFVCYDFYNKFREHYEKYTPFIARAEMDIADLITYKQTQYNKSDSVIEQIRKIFEKIVTDETLAGAIDSLVDNLK